MTNTKHLLWASSALALFVLAGCTTTAGSKTAEQRPDSYAFGEQEKSVVRSGFGECLRTGSWSAKDTVAECEPQTTARAAPAAAEQPIAAETDAAPAGEPAMAEAEPQPQPEPVLVRTYTGTDAYFEFNQATLAPDARAKLDNLVARVRDGREPMIEITGHADPIGSEQYNMELSQRRADAVRSYLVEQGVPEDAIRMEARGESDPVLRCEGRQGQELVQCLKPARVSEIIFSVVEEVPAP